MRLNDAENLVVADGLAGVVHINHPRVEGRTVAILVKDI
jgi:hypothetical protein